MSGGLFTSLSGVSAFGRNLDLTANNIANSNTDGFKKSRTEFVESAPAGLGVQTEIQKIDTPGVEALENTPQGQQLVEQSNVDLGEEMVNLIISQRGFEMNLAALRVQEETLGRLMDILT